MSKGKEITENSVTTLTRSIDGMGRKSGVSLSSLWYKYQERLTWKVWAALFVVTFGGVGFVATWQLLNLSKSPNCPKIFWPIASASLRLYCAQLDADSRTVEGLLRAIALVSALPEDHPLRPQADEKMEEWARDILNLAEKDYQTGNLERAIATARQIPRNAEVAKLIEERIAKWQETWTKGNQIIGQLEEHLRAASWNQAFRLAVDLLNLKNDYWATVKYNEAIGKISLAREESAQLDAATATFDRGGAKNWLAALEAVRKIRPESYAYQGARKLIGEIEETLQKYAANLIDRRDWKELQDIAERVPKDLAIKEEVTDWSLLANAALDAEAGTVESIESAIMSAGQIDASRPLHATARSMIDRWTLEITDLKTLTEARNLAEPGTIEALSAAIAKANLVPADNPRGREARRDIGEWTSQIQVIEDRPILEQARELAVPGDASSLRAAIERARQIGPDRALHKEASTDIRGWQSRVERIEDQPILDRAVSLASMKDYQAAIDTASQIRSGRVLADEAGQYIRRWRGEVNANSALQQAFRLAATETVDGFGRAIELTRGIPDTTDAGARKSESIDRWSYQLLTLASDQANMGRYNEAISIARRIPRDSAAYSSARQQIQSWRDILQPPAIQTMPDPTSIESPVSTPDPNTTGQ
ncbi:chromosome segregation ATPase [Pannus brasiliensis CCIBt3594]|uniref:Chromosome segregation ATPase n=1 Tax=Pannus brasiliensis CCIBt3594 TaxID=1427578 RepID=A0AAW9QUX6_9CHRO